MIFLLYAFVSRATFYCSQRYKAAGHDTIVLAGEEYGSGSSRDWAAKGPRLLVCFLSTIAIRSFFAFIPTQICDIVYVPLQSCYLHAYRLKSHTCINAPARSYCDKLSCFYVNKVLRGTHAVSNTAFGFCTTGKSKIFWIACRILP